MKLAVCGATGRMGRLVVQEVLSAEGLELVAAYGSPGSALLGRDVAEVVGLGSCGVGLMALGEAVPSEVDVVIDFSLPEGLERLIPRLGGVGLVTGTTGLSPAQRRALEAQQRRGAVLQAANFSLGVNLLLQLVERAARLMPEADVEIVEIHHKAKRDAPSGTALALGRAVSRGHGVALERAPAIFGRQGAVGARPPGEIGLHAVRGGDVAGEHTVHLLALGERLALSHSATSRETFAKGAVRAARWLCGRPPGRYQMNDVLDVV